MPDEGAGGGGGGGSGGSGAASHPSSVRPPREFNFDVPSSWPDFIYEFRQYLWLIGLRDNGCDREKEVRLMYHLGVKAETIMKTISFTDQHPRNFENIIAGFTAYFEPKKNTLFHRCIFNKRQQLENESAEHFIREVLALAEQCEFKDMKEEFTRDRLVVGIRDLKLSEELQEDHTITLNAVIEKIRSREQIKQQQSQIVGDKAAYYTGDQASNIDAITQKKQK
ncbi:hypothetical protein B566_EDAN000743 [Ephemera danica]|nr:hypothetical protein B566_EDAN000743 [Ephemera danica]